tara:strand:+ start:287 stop:523 length:237 start_codon:yes stop_codon:yes gene_type:complete
METNGKKVGISKDTLIPLSFVMLICGGVVWMNDKLGNIDNRLSNIERMAEDRWTTLDMENWALRLKMANPDIIIPSNN